MKSKNISSNFVFSQRIVSVGSRASVALLLPALLWGCASTKVAAEKPIAPRATTAASVQAAKEPTADELLRARLDAVMLEENELRASRRSVAATTAGRPRQVRLGATEVAGRLDPAIIQKEVRTNFGKFRACYEQGLKKNAQLSGRVSIRFVIGRDGSVTDVGGKDSDLPDQSVVECIVKAFKATKFPAPEGGIVTVVYPIKFSPGDDAPSSRPPPAPPPSPEVPQLPPPEPVAVAPIQSGASFDQSGKSDSGPIISIEGSAIRLSGIIVGDASGIIAANRMTKVDGLFDELKAWREIWKMQHPDKPFVGAAGLRVDANTPQVVFKSVFQTIAFAGYPDIFVQSADDPKQISEFVAQVPGPPTPDAETPTEPAPILQLHIHQDDLTLSWIRAGSVIAEKQIPRNDSALNRTICESWKTHGMHPELNDLRRDAIVLHADNGLSWKDVAPVALAVESCTREVRHLDDRTERMPVFWTIFSMR